MSGASSTVTQIATTNISAMPWTGGEATAGWFVATCEAPSHKFERYAMAACESTLVSMGAIAVRGVPLADWGYPRRSFQRNLIGSAPPPVWGNYLPLEGKKREELSQQNVSLVMQGDPLLC
jgi:hypothetical protein